VPEALDRKLPWGSSSSIIHIMSTIQHLLHIQHPIEKVFRAISTSDGLSNWYSRTEAFTAEEGATFKIYFGEMGFQFEVVEFIENKKIAWKCMEAAMPIEGHIMTYSLDENEGKTRLRFEHEGFETADDSMANMNFSSAKYLESLRQYCQTGNGEAFGSKRYRI
jgi:uncharacterized protein YndB with AHSA1/START domain